jgi:hypothetical protein
VACCRCREHVTEDVYRIAPAGLDFGAETNSAGGAHDDDIPDLINQFTENYRTGVSKGEIKECANFEDKNLVLKEEERM